LSSGFWDEYGRKEMVSLETNIATEILTGLKKADIDFVVSLPSSTLAPVIGKIAKDKRFVLDTKNEVTYTPV
jgi:sulfopyruvate decarboxylase TPP-binding subunit